MSPRRIGAARARKLPIRDMEMRAAGEAARGDSEREESVVVFGRICGKVKGESRR